MAYDCVRCPRRRPAPPRLPPPPPLTRFCVRPPPLFGHGWKVRANWDQHAAVAEAASALTAEARDLLDKMLSMDEGNRIDISGIKAHPWMTGPMDYDHDAQLAHIAALQEDVNKKVSALMEYVYNFSTAI